MLSRAGKSPACLRAISVIAFSVFFIPFSHAYPTGAPGCGPPGHGSYITPIPSDLSISVVDASTLLTASTWTAGHTYNVVFSASGATTFDGFLLAPLTGTPSSFGSSTPRSGSFAPGDSQGIVCDGCTGAVTHESNPAHSSVQVVWTPPSAGTGTVTLWGILVVTMSSGVNYNLKLAISEAATSATRTATVTVSPTSTRSVAASSAAASPATTASTSAAVSTSPAVTASTSAAATTSRTISATLSSSSTGTAGTTPSVSATMTASLSRGSTASQTATQTMSQSFSQTQTRTGSVSAASTASVTATATASVSATATQSRTTTQSPTRPAGSASTSAAATASPSVTASRAGASSPASSGTAAASASATAALLSGVAGASGNGPVIVSGSAVLTPVLTMSYSADAAVVSMTLDFTGAANTWFAFGFNPVAATMAGGDVMSFEPAYDAGPEPGSQVFAYTLTANSASGVRRVGTAATAAAVVGVDVSALPAGGVRLNFTRSRAAGTYAGAAPATGYLLYAIGSDGNGFASSVHATQGACAYDLNAGGGCVTQSQAAARIAHGALMFAAWGVLAPAGVAFARYGRALPPTSGPAACWFRAHWMLQAAAWLISAVGFIVIVATTPAGTHFSSAHSYVGIVVFVLGFLQPLNARCRPKKTPGQPPTRARFMWELAHKGAGYVAIGLSVAAIALGLLRLPAPAALVTAFAVIAACEGATVVTAEGFSAWTRFRRPAIVSRKTAGTSDAATSSDSSSKWPPPQALPHALVAHASNAPSWRRQTPFAHSPHVEPRDHATSITTSPLVALKSGGQLGSDNTAVA